MIFRITILAFALLAWLSIHASADTLDDIRARGELVWGADSEGGGPYVFPDSDNPRQVTGFEVELAEELAKKLGVKAKFFQGPWDKLPALLNKGDIDILLNGYELTPGHAAVMDATVPYYVYDLALLVRKDDKHIQNWEDLRKPIDGHKVRLGGLGTSAAFAYLEQRFGDSLELVSYDGNTDAMREVETGKLDATVADLPVAIFYRDRFKDLRQIPEAAGRGSYAIFVRQKEDRLREAINGALHELLASEELQRVYKRYDLWSPAQEKLPKLMAEASANDKSIRATSLGGWQVVRHCGPLLLEAATVTVRLAIYSFPLSIALGLVVALARLYGPAPVRWLAIGYIEILRGTPLVLQLFVIYFLLPEIGLNLPPMLAAVAALAINYSAYEAEIYRSGLQAIPHGQMEAALSLGMSQSLALRRVIIPQAMRIVIPPMTSDFIALFKDTAVCSVITIVELAKRYSIEVNNTGATLELAAVTATLYLLMSLPLAHLASRLEKNLQRGSKVNTA